MEFGSTPKRSKLDSGHVAVAHEDFSDDLPFYSFPPTGKIDLIEVDAMVNERLSILEVFEELKISEIGQSRNLADHIGTIRERLKQVESGFGDNFITTLHARTLGAHNTLKKDARRRDQISHFLLRLYFCNPQEKKTWFVNRETELLRYRLLEETVGKATTNALSGQKNDSSVVAQMILKNGLNYEPVYLGNSDYDRDLRRKASFNNLFVTNDDKSPFYRILFEDALDVIRMRKAYLQDGYAYVSTHDMISLICTKFKQELNTALSRLNMRRSDEEHRLLPIINNIYLKKIASARKLKADASGKMKEVVTPDMIDNLSLEHFPPCMENIHLNLRKNHHVKYGGRLHYGLFLKGIGLSLEDAVKFFRDEFIQKLAPEKFDKEYRYGIRYNYGKEGKKVDFSPYGCEKIINSTPGVGDVHGCPFKHFDWTNLKKFLARKGVGDEALQNIESLVEEKNYSRACGIYFTVRHPSHQIADEGITHPNTFYTESRKALQRNPKREDLILEDEIDHYTGSFLPEEETLTQDITQEIAASVSEAPGVSESPEDSKAPETHEAFEVPEPMDSSEIEFTSVDPSQSAIEESILEKEHHKLETIIEPLDDPKETEIDDHANQPEQ